MKSEVISSLSNVKCYKTNKHAIPVIELLSLKPSLSISSQVFFVCEQKHIWNYEYNPRVDPKNPLIPDQKIDDLKSMDNTFHNAVYLYLPFPVAQHYDYFQSLYILGYSYGAAIAIRSLIELFIRDNYGNFIFQLSKKPQLHYKGDAQTLDEITEKLKSPGLTVIMAALAGNTYQGNRRIGDLAKARFNATSTDKIWIGSSDFGRLGDVYKKVSKTVHSDPMNQLLDFKTLMETVLGILKTYLSRNHWMVEYG